MLLKAHINLTKPLILDGKEIANLGNIEITSAQGI